MSAREAIDRRHDTIILVLAVMFLSVLIGVFYEFYWIPVIVILMVHLFLFYLVWYSHRMSREQK